MIEKFTCFLKYVWNDTTDPDPKFDWRIGSDPTNILRNRRDLWYKREMIYCANINQNQPGRNRAICKMVIRSSCPAATATGFFWSFSSALAILIAGSLFLWADCADWAKWAAAAAAIAAFDCASEWAVVLLEELFSCRSTEGVKERKTWSGISFRLGRHLLSAVMVSTDITCVWCGSCGGFSTGGGWYWLTLFGMGGRVWSSNPEFHTSKFGVGRLFIALIAGNLSKPDPDRADSSLIIREATSVISSSCSLAAGEPVSCGI